MHKETKFGNTTYHAQVRTWKTPTIKDEFVNDDGVLTYVLESGATVAADRFNNLWHPVKSQVNWSAKGNRIDSPQRKY